jgi:hypothetical protein
MSYEHQRVGCLGQSSVVAKHTCLPKRGMTYLLRKYAILDSRNCNDENIER